MSDMADFALTEHWAEVAHYEDATIARAESIRTVKLIKESKDESALGP